MQKKAQATENGSRGEEGIQEEYLINPSGKRKGRYYDFNSALRQRRFYAELGRKEKDTIIQAYY